MVASFVMLLALLYLACALARPADAAAFSDTSGHWAEAAIEQAAKSGYIKGYPEGTFRPDQRVSRAEFVAVLNAAFGVPKATSTAISFKDVSAKDWFAEAVRSAVAAGYASGYPDGTFRPYQSVTRVEAAVFLARVLNISGNAALKFADASQIDEWARPAVAALVEKGVLSGYPDGTFRPQRPITRAEAVVLVNSACGLSRSEPVIAYLLVTGSRVNIRSGPGTSYGIIGQVEEGDVLEAMGESNGWYKVRFQGKTGWIAGWLVEVHTTKPPARGEPGTLDVRCKEDAGGVTVVITACEAAEFSWKELSGPQRLVVTVPGVTVVRTPSVISVNKAGLEKVTTSLQGSKAEVVLSFGLLQGGKGFARRVAGWHPLSDKPGCRQGG